MPRRYVAVCGASEATSSQLDAAREVGKLLARNGAVVLNGGYGGVMSAVSEGAASEGGTVVGLLSESDRDGKRDRDRKGVGDLERDRTRAQARTHGRCAGHLGRAGSRGRGVSGRSGTACACDELRSASCSSPTDGTSSTTTRQRERAPLESPPRGMGHGRTLAPGPDLPPAA